MISVNGSQRPDLNMQSTFPSNLDARKSKPDEKSGASKLNKQQDAKYAIKKPPVVPYQQGSTSPDRDFHGLGDQFSILLSLHPLELELDDPASQPAPAGNTPQNIEQDLQGFGAQLAMAVDPRDNFALLGNDLENLRFSDV